MPVSEKQKRYADKYIKSTFDEIKVRVPKGRKAEIQSHARSTGESVNGFINRAIDETIEREGHSVPEDEAAPDEIEALRIAEQEMVNGDTIPANEIDWS